MQPKAAPAECGFLEEETEQQPLVSPLFPVLTADETRGQRARAGGLGEPLGLGWRSRNRDPPGWDRGAGTRTPRAGTEEPALSLQHHPAPSLGVSEPTRGVRVTSRHSHPTPTPPFSTRQVLARAAVL